VSGMKDRDELISTRTLRSFLQHGTYGWFKPEQIPNQKKFNSMHYQDSKISSCTADSKRV
jgi:hypothetical protein